MELQRPPLSPDQLLAFKVEGVVVCRGLVPKSTTARWREQIWNTLEADPDDPSTYASAAGHPRLRGAGSEARPVANPALCELPQVQAIVEQLCDDKMKNVSPDTELIINWGHRHQEEQPVTWEEPPDGHLDGYVSPAPHASQAFLRALRVCAPEQGGNRWGGGYMLAATCYVNDVLPDGGAFAYWPKSHRAVHNYFRRNPLGLDGQYIQWPEVQEHGHRALWGSDPTTEVSPHPAIWAASEGDVCFCTSTPAPSAGFLNDDHVSREMFAQGMARSFTAPPPTCASRGLRCSVAGRTRRCAWTASGSTSARGRSRRGRRSCRRTTPGGGICGTTCRRIRGGIGARPCARPAARSSDIQTITLTHIHLHDMHGSSVAALGSHADEERNRPERVESG